MPLSFLQLQRYKSLVILKSVKKFLTELSKSFSLEELDVIIDMAQAPSFYRFLVESIIAELRVLVLFLFFRFINPRYNKGLGALKQLLHVGSCC